MKFFTVGIKWENLLRYCKYYYELTKDTVKVIKLRIAAGLFYDYVELLKGKREVLKIFTTDFQVLKKTLKIYYFVGKSRSRNQSHVYLLQLLKV